MKQIKVTEELNTKRSKNHLLCCFGCTHSTDSLASINEQINEPYEYIVEKLVIKRVPVKQNAAGDELRLLDTPSFVNKVDDKSVITFSSYCQIPPSNFKNNSKKDKEIENQKKLLKSRNESVSDIYEEKEENEKNERYIKCEHLDKPRSRKNSAQKRPLSSRSTKKKENESPNLNGQILFVKQMSRESSPNNCVEDSLKNTIDTLGTKKPSSKKNRRFVNRDPDTGQIKEIFKNVNIEEPLKIDKLFSKKSTNNSTIRNETSSKMGGDGFHPSLLKWKIIIKHKDDKNGKTSDSSD